MRPHTDRRELGQILMISALLLPVLLAMAGMAIDVGTYSANRRSLQNAADGAALAGGQELPDASAATDKALEYTSDHGIDPSHVTVAVTGGNTTPAIRVSISRTHDFSFMAIVGIGSKDVGAAAAAGKFSYGSGNGVVPWAIEEQWLQTISSGDEVVIKYDSNGTSPGQGNFGPIRIDGNGSSDYDDSAKYGADTVICSLATPDCTTGVCPGTFPSPCSEDSPECDGPECPPKTGNMTGNTQNAVDYRMDYTSTACDDFGEVFTPISAFHEGFEDAIEFQGAGGRMAAPPPHHGSGGHETFTPTRTNTPVATSTPAATNTAGPTSTPGSGSDQQYRLNAACNPWGAGSCADTTSLCSRRVFLIPIINEFGNGSSDLLEIRGFAMVFLEGYDGSCTGSSCDVRARFVRAEVTAAGFTANDYDEDAFNHFVKLIE